MPVDTKEQRAEREKKRLEWVDRKRILDGISDAAARKRRIAEKEEARHRASITYRGQVYYRYWSSRPYGVRARSIYIQVPGQSPLRYWIPY